MCCNLFSTLAQVGLFAQWYSTVTNSVYSVSLDPFSFYSWAQTGLPQTICSVYT